jgi:hypothetical protein
MVGLSTKLSLRSGCSVQVMAWSRNGGPMHPQIRKGGIIFYTGPPRIIAWVGFVAARAEPKAQRTAN